MITITDPASKRLSSLLDQEAPGMFLRIEVTPGGCSGFRYSMYFDSDITAGDTVVEATGVKVVLDEASSPLLDGATLDFRESLNDAGFKIENPNATRSCGCGKSFNS